MSLTFIYDGNSKGLIVRTTEIALSPDCARCCTISRLRTGATQSRDCVNPVRNLEIGSQFRDSENAQRNLEFVQIPRFHGTEIKAVVDRQIELDDERSAMQLHAMLTNKHDINVSLRTVLRCRTSLGWTFRGSE